MLKVGLYEQIINQELEKRLSKEPSLLATREALSEERAPEILAQYLTEIIENEILQLKPFNLANQIDYVNKIIDMIGQINANIVLPAQQLFALSDVSDKYPSINNELSRPRSSLSKSTLFTGAAHEPTLYSELKREISSANRVDMLVSFIKWSGLRLILPELIKFTNNGGELRIITTTYMGATDVKAVAELHKLANTKIKVSYDTKRTRLHAKAYTFYRETGFTTAYIGSSNLSNAAISSGLEWNLKITAKDQPDTLMKIAATFDSYWHNDEFKLYGDKDIALLRQALQAERTSDISGSTFNFEIAPYPYQQEILTKLQAERTLHGYNYNLIVAATGTGKTVISAFDYFNYCLLNKTQANRLLFVAHRVEILKQSIDCFRSVLRDRNFGDLFVGDYFPKKIDHLFISIQTLNSQNFISQTRYDYYDYIIIDEFHHAAAQTYQQLLNYYRPKILLGLTATPERMDGQDITSYFNNRIAAEIRLPEAIDRKLLSPFQYFGISDSVNLNSLQWVRGGYQKSDLSAVYTHNNERTQLIIEQTLKYVTDVIEVAGLGFCVSQEHAEYMASSFNKANIPAMFLTSKSNDEERFSAKTRLNKKEINFIFVVDIYNEGIDIPEINTILFLRPTESLTVFLQQLGRGLRLHRDKECLTVLDFIGQANKRYSFADKFSTLLHLSNRTVTQEITEGFTTLPTGCYIQLEKKAQEYILANITSSIINKTSLVNKIVGFNEATKQELTLANFLTYYQLDISTIYKIQNQNFTRLKVAARIIPDFSDEFEKILTKAFPRIIAINSRRWLRFMIDYLPKLNQLTPNEEQLRMLNMLHYTIFLASSQEVKNSLSHTLNNSALFSELMEIFQYNYDHIDFIDQKIDLGFACPIDLHCNYTRDQILVAMDFQNPSTVREGVKYLPDKNVDIFFVTLNKSDKQYSPSNMYNDYPISESLFHWQSQSTTGANSQTAKRYIDHKRMNHRILLFVREYKNDLVGTAPYTCLGLCEFVQFEGSHPMNIVWRLQKAMPAKYIKANLIH